MSRFIQFDTSNPPGREIEAIEFLAEILQVRGFAPKILQSAPQRANLIARWSPPTPATAPPLLLYAHADVVPANAEQWSHPPFAGHIQDGFVWGRGALDDKGLAIIFLQILSLLRQYAPFLKRDIILLIAADEEAGSKHGVPWLLDHHSDLIQAEYVWDEGGLGFQRTTEPAAYLYGIAIAEKRALTVRLVAHGKAGHAAMPQADNPQERLVQALSRIRRWERPARLSPPVIQMLKYLAPSQPFPRSILMQQAHQSWLWPLLRPALENNSIFTPLIRNTVNLTMLRGGQATNVISDQAEAKLDIRLLPGENPIEILADLRSIVADGKVLVEAEDMPASDSITSTDTDFYRALAQTIEELGPQGLITPYLTPGATDSRFFRQAGMKAYGFSPLILDSHETSRIHGVDERVSIANLRWGLQCVWQTIQRLG